MESIAKRRRTSRGGVTIHDVAGRAGVSTATVSRALASPETVTEATRERVLSAVDATGYTPNRAARSLRVQRTMTVLTRRRTNRRPVCTGRSKRLPERLENRAP